MPWNRCVASALGAVVMGVAVMSWFSLAAAAQEKQDDRKKKQEPDSLAESARSQPQPLQSAMNRWYSAQGSLFLNMDSDNDDADTQSFQVVKNSGTDTGGTTLLRVLETGKVGIGTTNPTHLLTLQSPDVSTMRLIGPTGSFGWNARLNFGDQNFAYIEEDEDDRLLLRANRFAFTVGNVGIGTTAPAYPLHVETGLGIGVFASTANASGVGVYGEATSSTGTNYGVYGLSSSNAGFGMYGYAAASTGTAYGGWFQSASTAGRGVGGFASATSGQTLGGRFESASTTGTGVFGFASAETGATQGGWFQSVSENGIGVYATTGRANGSAPCIGVYGRSFNTYFGTGVKGLTQSNVGVHWAGEGTCNSGQGFDFYANGAGLDFGTSSSRRWKADIQEIDYPLEKLAQLRGVYYTWDKEHGGHHDIGMIAEEVGTVLPEIVRYEENGIDAIGMDYSKLTPLLVEAVNALRAENESQLTQRDSRIAQLEQENQILSERMAALEARFAAMAAND